MTSASGMITRTSSMSMAGTAGRLRPGAGRGGEGRCSQQSDQDRGDERERAREATYGGGWGSVITSHRVSNLDLLGPAPSGLVACDA